MKRIVLSIMGLTLALGATAQTIVSTTPENRKVVLEEFTGINCTYCPDGHKRANQLAAANPGNVSLINIHQGSYANATPDYRTQWGDAIANQTGLTGYPAGTINRHVFSGSSTALGRGDWATRAATILAMPSFVNIAATAEIDAQTRVMTVHVEVYYTGDATEASNFLNVALVQDNVYGPQVGATTFYPEMMTADGLYTHNHMLRDLLTGQWGEELTVQGETVIPATSYFAKDYTYTLPASVGPVSVELGNLELVAFVAQGHQEIYTGVTFTPTYTNIPTEINMTSVNGTPVQQGNITVQQGGVTLTAELGCNNLAKPSFSIKNMCGTTITSMTINYTGATQPYQWTGNLVTFATTTIELNPVEVSLGVSDTITVTIDEVNGDAPQGTAPYMTLNGAINKPNLLDGQGQPTLLLKLDKYGSETTWKVKDINGTVLQSGGPYSDVSTAPSKPDTIILTGVTGVGCFIFEIYDAYGDGINSGYGTGNYKIVDLQGTILVQSNGKFGSGEKRDFKIENFNGLERVSGDVYQTLLYPNPAGNSTTLEISLTQNAVANVSVVDMLGREVISLDNRALGSGSNKIELNTSDLLNGLYFVRVTTENGTSTKKLAIKR
ncbi:MAG: Omp28-related outer membrane protein [Bacteroidales bacterium]|jgi:hypothetical protein|nr:Omp28-related outer membrane protein [Bacteroidales bacterium]